MIHSGMFLVCFGCTLYAGMLIFSTIREKFTSNTQEMLFYPRLAVTLVLAECLLQALFANFGDVMKLFGGTGPLKNWAEWPTYMLLSSVVDWYSILSNAAFPYLMYRFVICLREKQVGY